jgi:hypothetical protein
MIISFCFSFFPNVLQPPIALVGNTVHEFLVRIGICHRTVRKFDMAAAPTGITISLPGIDPHDMERRRLDWRYVNKLNFNVHEYFESVQSLE